MFIKNLSLLLLFWPFQRVMAQPLLLAGWDFQTTAGGGTEVLASPLTPALFQANFGVGTLYLNGEYGSSPWSSTQRTAYAGSNINTSGTSFSNLTTGLGSLGLLSGSGLNGNGKSLVFKIPMRNRQGLSVSYSAQRSSTGFSQHRWEISYDLVQWNMTDSVQSGTGSGTITNSFSNTGIIYIDRFGSVSIGDTAYLRLTLDGSSSSSGNNRLDNFQIRAWPTEISADTLRISTNQTLNDLTVSGGTLLVDAGATLTINGTLTVSGGTITNNGTIAYGAAGALVYGSSNRTVGAEWPSSNGPLNVTIGSGGVTLGVARTISSTGKLTLNGVFTTGGNLTLASNVNGTAVVVGGGNANITGNVTVQRYLPWTGTNHNGFRFVGHPLRSNPALNTVTNLPTATNTVIGYSNASNNYTAISDRTTTWPQAVGYGVWTNLTNTLAFSGELQLSDVPAVSMGTDSNRWNYAANPFPSVLDWHGVTKTNIEGTIYRWDKNTDTLSAGSGQAKGKWGTYVQSTQVSANGGSRYMAPMQGFMVQASSGASSASLAYPSSARVDQSATYVRQQQTPDVARASVTHNTSGFGLETVLCFLPQASNAYDPDLEARYVSDGVSASQDLYTKDAQGQTYAIQSLPEMSIHNTTRIPLHLENTQAGATYSWSMDLSGLRSGHQSWLEDTRLGTLTPVVSGQPITFTTQAGDAVDRFHWVFAAQGTAVPALESAEKVNAHLSDGRLNLRGLRQGPATLQWMDLSGRLLSNQTLNDPDMLQACPENLREGHYYLLRVQSPQGLYHFRLRR